VDASKRKNYGLCVRLTSREWNPGYSKSLAWPLPSRFAIACNFVIVPIAVVGFRTRKCVLSLILCHNPPCLEDPPREDELPGLEDIDIDIADVTEAGEVEGRRESSRAVVGCNDDEDGADLDIGMGGVM